MKKYQVLIDGEISANTFTFDELFEMGLLDDYDDHIHLRATGESTWYIAREYPFHISESGNIKNNRNLVNNDNMNNSNRNNYTIDEYGQVIRGDGGKRFDVSNSYLKFTSDSSSQTIYIYSNGNWEISLGAASWVNLTSNGVSLIVKVDKNYSKTSRTDYFRLRSGNEEIRVDIYQSGYSASPTPSSNNDDNSGCIWFVIIVIIIVLFSLFSK